MKRTTRVFQIKRRMAGFALVSAIFLLVVLAALAAFIVQMSTRQQVAAAADVQSARAYQAAKTGIDLALYYYLRPAAPNCLPVYSGPLTGSLAGFTVTVRCQGSVSNDENGTSVALRRFVATACNQPAGGNCPNTAPGANYIEREIAVVTGR